MALPSNPPISLSQVAAELGTSPEWFSMGSAAARNLAGKPEGWINLSDFLGKSAVDLTPNPLSLPRMSASYNSVNGSSSMPNYTDSANIVVSGITGTVTLQFIGSADSGQSGGGFFHVRKNGGNWQLIMQSSVGGAPELHNPTLTFNNGDNFSFRFGILGVLASQFDPYRTAFWSAAVVIRNVSMGNAQLGIQYGDGNMSDQYSNSGGGDGPIIDP